MPTQYVNKATLNGTTTVYWTTTGAADPTGAQSGYNPVNLTNIGVDYTTEVFTTTTGGQTLNNGGWQTALDLDFTAQGTQTLSSNTTYTIGGLSWTKTNSANEAASATIDSNGLTFQPSSATDLNGATLTLPGIHCLLKNIIPNFDLSMGIRVTIYNSSLNNAANYDNAVVGISTNNTTFGVHVKRGHGTSGQGFQSTYTRSGANVSGFISSGLAPSSTNDCLVIEIPEIGNFRGFKTYDGDYSTGFPNMSAVSPHKGYLVATGTQNNDDLTINNLGIFLGAQRAGSGTSLVVRYARIKVEYMTAAPITLGTICLSDASTNLPAAGVAGRLFLPTDSNNDVIYRDNGSTWDTFELDAKPAYADIDSNTVLCWRFQEASAPFPNLGTQASEDMTAESGEGTVWAGGQPDNAFGKALKFSMVSTGSGGIRANNFTFPTSVITASIWVTPTRSVGAVSIGRIFFKAYYPSSWSSPYIGIEMGYFGATSGFTVTANATGGAAVATANQDYNGIPLWQRHHIGMTFGDGYLRLYADGYLVKTTVSSNTLDLGTGPWCIGRTVSSSSNEHCGMILHEARVDKVIRDATWFYNTWKKGKVR